MKASWLSCLAWLLISLPAGAQVQVLNHARLVDVEAGRVLEDHALVIRDGLIDRILPAAELGATDPNTVTDLGGRTVIPGLVMVHEHLFFSDHLSPEFHVHNQPYAFPRLYLAAGVTTARTGAAVEPYTDLAIAAAIEAGEIPGPTLDVTSPLMGGPEPLLRQGAALASPEAVRQFVNFWADAGVTSFKLYMSAPPEIVAAAVEAAHARGLKVTGHLCATTYAEAAGLGIDNLEHGFFAATDFAPEREAGECTETPNEVFASLSPELPEVQSLYRTLIENDVAVTSTLAVFASGSTEHDPLDPGTIDAMTPAALANFMAYRGATALRQRELPVDSAAVLRAGMALEAGFYRAGGRLVVGTDPTGPGGVVAGHGSHWALELLQEAGLTPMEVLRVATIDGAEFLGLDHDRGSLAAGKRADLAVIDGEPDRDIRALRRVETVYRGGVAHDTAELLRDVRKMVGGPVGIRSTR